jgi:hypothetical protein
MTFPVSPANNTVVLVNGVNYVYNSTQNSWTKVPNSATSIDYSQVIFNTANLAYLQANTATTNAGLAWNTANSALPLSGGTLSGSLQINGNLGVTGNINFTGNVINTTITGNTGQFFGYASNGFNALYAGVPTGFTIEGNTVFQATTNSNTYSQIENQNLATGTQASTDFVATNDNPYGDSYIDMGINSTVYNQAAYSAQYAGDGYIYVNANTSFAGGNLVISTTTSKDIIFTTGGTQSTNEIARFKNGVGLVMYQNPITFADSSSQNTAASPAAYSQGSYAAANAAFIKANSAIQNTSGSMSGTLYVNSLSSNTGATLNTNGYITTTAFTTASTTQVTIDSWSSSTYRSAKYDVQITSGTSYHVIEIRVLTDGTSAWLTQYGEMFTGSSLGTFDASVSAGTVQLLFTATNAITTVKLLKTNITI